MRYFGREGRLFGAPVRLLDEIKDDPEKTRDSLMCTGHFLSELNSYFKEPHSYDIKEYGIKLVPEEEHVSENSADAGSEGSVLSRIQKRLHGSVIPTNSHLKIRFDARK